ncbi:MAG TPA: penicillin acylase family protein, partial [Pyrinomonadaceae bacterium]|nr:penicillin acylase family protein [Pyrinomonadaceae bacterium]
MRRLAVLFLASLFLVIPLNPGQTAPQQTAVEIKGIKNRITIRRDERGIPYVEAQNDEDLFFGQGYATAQDRLWQLDLFRRTARGELAEVLGTGPNNLA